FPGQSFDWLPLLLLLVATGVALQSELRHATCDNEQRWENQMMCQGKEFGCQVPYPDNCSLYLVCDCVYPTVRPCPAQLWWDNVTRACNYPQATECIYYTFTTPLPTTTERTTSRTTRQPLTTSTEPENWPTSSWDPPPPPPGIKDTFCKGLPDGSVHRYPYDCNAYINCTFGWPVLNYCERDKVFNELLLICDTPDTAECEPLPLPSTTPEPSTKPPTSTVEPSTTTVEPLTTTVEPSTTETTAADVECGPPPLGVEPDYCWHLGNGFYEYLFDCSAYISCRNGCSDLAYCIPGKLFNPLLHICDTPNSVTCNPQPYPTTSTEGSTPHTTTTLMPSDSTTTSPPETTTLPPDVDANSCEGLPDYSRLPIASNCSQFVQCKDNEVILGHCSNGLLFNPDLLICDDADDVLCYGDRTTSAATTTTPATTTTTTTVATTTTAGPAQLCEGQSVGDSFPYVEDCTQYILCLGDGKYYLAPCAGGYYDPKTGSCGPNVSPTACKEKDSTTTTPATTRTTPSTTTAVTPSTPRPVAPDGICAGRSDGEMIAYPNDCSKYIVCVSPIPIGFYCLEGSFFSAERQQCVRYEDSDCEQQISTTPGYTQPPPEPTMCTNSSRDTFPYPENCQWFIRCVGEYIYMMDVCNCGEYYDPIAGACGPDVPHDACRWDYTSTTPEAETTTAVTRPPPQKGPCDDAADGERVPYPNDCSKYIQCDRPIASAYDCDAGEEFSPEERKCMDASLANCNPEPTTTEKPSTEEPSTTTTPLPATTSPPWVNPTEPTTTEKPSTEEPSTTTTPPPATTSPPWVNPTEPTTTEKPSTEELSTTHDSSTTVETSPTGEGSTATTPQTSTTPETSTTTEGASTVPPGGICGGKPLGSLVPYPNNCGKYIVCDVPIPIGYDCEEGLEFSPTELECMHPDLANCNPKPTTAAPTTTTTESSSSPTPVITDSTSTITDTTATSSTVTDSTTTDVTPTPTTTDSTTTDEPCTSTPAKTDSTTSDSTPTITDTTTTSTTVTDSTTTESTTITDSTTTAITPTITTTAQSTTTTMGTTTPIHPDTPNICCGFPLGTILAYPNDCNRYVVCDYPIPYAVVCAEGTVFDPNELQCTSEGVDSCY
ncbi:hypothetical protein KR044_010354, partial [Drosophila immigrans]